MKLVAAALVVGLLSGGCAKQPRIVFDWPFVPEPLFRTPGPYPPRGTPDPLGLLIIRCNDDYSWCDAPLYNDPARRQRL